MQTANVTGTELLKCVYEAKRGFLPVSAPHTM